MTGFSIANILSIPETKYIGDIDISATQIPGISIDTRTLVAGEVYVALRGTQFDGHSFVDAAYQQSALACIVDQMWYESQSTSNKARNLIVVPDTLDWLGRIANAYRKQYSIPVLGITGSNGKTTTKEMLRHVLQTKYDVMATSGNYNNLVGVPLTLFQLDASHDFAIVEMGTNQPGDIEALCRIAEPTHGVITNIGRSHLELLGSVTAVAEEKLHLFQSLPTGGTAFVNADDGHLNTYQEAQRSVVSFGRTADAEYQITGCELDAEGLPSVTISSATLPGGGATVQMTTPGLHNAYTAAIAIAIGRTMGCPTEELVQAIESFSSPGKRMKVYHTAGITIIDDTYNANPDSTIAAIDTLYAMSTDGRRVFVFGDMLELGQESERLHAEIGSYAANRGVKILYTYGPNAYAAHKSAEGIASTIHFEDQVALILRLKDEVRQGDVVLVKGSRGMNMTPIVSEMMSYATEVQE